MRLQRVGEPHSSVAPSAVSGASLVDMITWVGGSGVNDARNPNGVSVNVDVAVGRGVILGNAVIVLDGVIVGFKRVE